jgi:hypothetical protein
MTTLEKKIENLLLKLETMTLENLKITAITLKDDVTDAGFIVSERINSFLRTFSFEIFFDLLNLF